MDEHDDCSFGDLLRHFRQRKRLSQQRLAERAEVHRNSISLWERDLERPETLGSVLTLAKILDLNEEEKRLFCEVRFGTASLLSLYNVPFERNPYFTGREDLLQHLHTQLAQGAHSALPQALCGLGGIGKTQTAIEYAYRYQKSYHDVLWASADSYEILVAAFVELARCLRLLERNEKDQNRIVAAVKHWLISHKGWLLILDNVEDLNLVKQFVPSGRQGVVVVTTRRQATEPVAQAIELANLSEKEGALFLLRRCKLLALTSPREEVSIQNYQQAADISRVLGGLPLALDQAGAYILETRCSLAEYLPLYERRHADLLARRGGGLFEHPDSVTTTFSLAFEHVQQKNPAAVELLQMCAFLAPDAIPEALITTGSVHLGPILQPVVSEPYALNDVMEVLGTLSLIQRHTSGKMLSLHRLVQIVLRCGMSEITQQEWIARCLRLLDLTFPLGQMIVEHWKWCESLLPHVQACVALSAEGEEVCLPETAALCYKTAKYLYDRAQYADAEEFYTLKGHNLRVEASEKQASRVSPKQGGDGQWFQTNRWR